MDCPYMAAAALTSIVAPSMLARPNDACHVVNVTSAAGESAFRAAVGAPARDPNVTVPSRRTSIVRPRGTLATFESDPSPAQVGYGAARWAMRGFSRYLARDLAGTNVGVTLLVPAEVKGTSRCPRVEIRSLQAEGRLDSNAAVFRYFADAPGKAGSLSYARIPSLMQAVDGLGLNWSAARVARAALDGVERGDASVLAPWHLMVPLKMLVDVTPGLVEFLCALGPAGRRVPPVSAVPIKSD